MADMAAKESLNNHLIVRLPMSYGEYKSTIKSFIYNQWQLKSFKPILGDWKSAYRDNRRDEKVLSRLRTGYCLFKMQHIFNRDKPKERCNTCGMDMTIKHLLIDCPNFQNSRNRISNYLNQKHLELNEYNIMSDTFPHKLLFIFLKETNFYKKI